MPRLSSHYIYYRYLKEEYQISKLSIKTFVGIVNYMLNKACQFQCYWPVIYCEKLNSTYFKIREITYYEINTRFCFAYTYSVYFNNQEEKYCLSSWWQDQVLPVTHTRTLGYCNSSKCYLLFKWLYIMIRVKRCYVRPVDTVTRVF